MHCLLHISPKFEGPLVVADCATAVVSPANKQALPAARMSRPASGRSERPSSSGSRRARAKKELLSSVDVPAATVEDLIAAGNRNEALSLGAELVAQRETKILALREELFALQLRSKDVSRSHARRLLQIASLEHTWEQGREREARLEFELEKFCLMKEQVFVFRDKDTAAECAALKEHNAELIDKVRARLSPRSRTQHIPIGRCLAHSARSCSQAEKWKARFEMLQQERWRFVRQWKDAQAQRAAEEQSEREKVA